MPQVRRPFSIMNDDKYFYVRLTMSVWPEIYGDEKPILFPTEKAAMRFAECNLSTLIPRARVYTPDHKLVSVLQFA
jgi:hypothetical protein